MSPRIQKELACAQNGSTEGINVSLPNPNNLHIWKVLMKGPEGSPYEGGIF
jgi:ubiquitin-protein ligase